jgi:hypothetical protein
MRRWLFAPAVLAALIVGALPAGAQQAGWAPFSSPEGRFSVRLPEPPQHMTEQESDPRVPTPLTSHTFMSIDGRRHYVVSYVDYPAGFKGDVEIELGASRESFVKRVNGKLGGSKRVEIRRGNDVLPAEEFTVTEGDNEHTVITILDNERPYQVVAVIPKDEAKEAAADVKAYFDSFKIAPK